MCCSTCCCPQPHMSGMQPGQEVIAKKKGKSQKEKADHSCSSSAGLHTPACSSADRKCILKGRLMVPSEAFLRRWQQSFCWLQTEHAETWPSSQPRALLQPQEAEPILPREGCAELSKRRIPFSCPATLSLGRSSRHSGGPPSSFPIGVPGSAGLWNVFLTHIQDSLTCLV